MSLFCRLSRKHYWCTPHRSADNRLIQVCYECGAERPVRELHNDFLPRGFDHLNASDATGSLRAYPRPIEEPANESLNRAPVQEKIAVGQSRARKFIIVK